MMLQYITSLGMAIIAFFAVIIIGIPFLIYNGWAFSVLWNIFVVPLNMPPITIYQAMGIFLVVGLLKGQSSVKNLIDMDEERRLHMFMAGLLSPLLAVAIGHGIIYFTR